MNKIIKYLLIICLFSVLIVPIFAQEPVPEDILVEIQGVVKTTAGYPGSGTLRIEGGTSSKSEDVSGNGFFSTFVELNTICGTRVTLTLLFDDVKVGTISFTACYSGRDLTVSGDLTVTGGLTVGGGPTISKIVFGTVRFDATGKTTGTTGSGFTTSIGPTDKATACVNINFEPGFSDRPSVIVQRDSDTANDYQFKPGAYETDEDGFRLCATYRKYDGASGEWTSGDVVVSFIAIG